MIGNERQTQKMLRG